MTRSKAAAAIRLAILPVMVAIALLVAWKAGYLDLDRRQALAHAVDNVRALPGSSLLFVLIFAVGVALCFPANAATWLAGGVTAGMLLVSLVVGIVRRSGKQH